MKYQPLLINTFINISLIVVLATFVISCTNQTSAKLIDVRQLENSYETVVVNGQGYFPVIIATPTDEVHVVLRGGAPHMGIGGRLDLVRSLNAGVTWSTPQVIVDSEKDDRNPSLGQASDGTLVLAYHWRCHMARHGR